MKAQTSQELAEQLIQAWTPSGFRTTKAVALIDAYVLEREAEARMAEHLSECPCGRRGDYYLSTNCGRRVQLESATTRASQRSPREKPR